MAELGENIKSFSNETKNLFEEWKSGKATHCRCISIYNKGFIKYDKSTRGINFSEYGVGFTW